MASQLALAHQISEMKAALKKRPYESDSDESITHSSNRGQKLKKRSRYTTLKQLAPASSPRIYKEEIEYAGVKRRIIDRNPTPVDDEGYMVDGYCSDERQEEARANVADINPYSSVHLEHILAPLTSVTDLPDHPTLSVPFRSKTLAELSNQASELVRREHKSLWKGRRLMTGLCGDFMWLPCGPLVGPNDIDLFAEDNALQERRKSRALLPGPGASSTPMTNGDKDAPVNGSASDALAPGADSTGTKQSDGEDKPMKDKNGESHPAHMADEDKSPKQHADTSNDAPPDNNPKTEASAATEGHGAPGSDDAKEKPAEAEKAKGDGPEANKADDIKMQDAGHDDTTNTEVVEQNPNGRPPQDLAQAVDQSDDVFIHPFFNPPALPLPDRDMGLPENEAENVRHLMSLYVQKQEEISRGAQKLYQGLMRADRLRATVLQWAKAEAHVGELSDGEDWYDKEEWRLDGELKKGQDEEEEDTTQPVKKTRNRRQ